MATMLDYAAAHSRTQLFEWAIREFSLPAPSGDEPQEFLKHLFDVQAQRGKRYQVLERNTKQIAPAVDRLINGFGGSKMGGNRYRVSIWRERGLEPVSYSRKSIGGPVIETTVNLYLKVLAGAARIKWTPTLPK